MALTPSKADANRDAELKRIDKMASSPEGREKVKIEFNQDVDPSNKVDRAKLTGKA